MEFYKALEEIKIKNKAAYTLIRSEKTIFIMDYDSDPERYAEIMIFYYKDFGDSSTEEDALNIDESLNEFPFIKDLDFILIEKSGMDALGLTYDYAVKDLKESEVLS